MSTADRPQAYQRMRETFQQAKPDALAEQLHRAEAQSPELHAAFGALALMLYREIDALDDRRGREGGESIVAILPPAVVNAALALPLLAQLGLDKRALCEKLNRWAARRFFDDLGRGIVNEPAHYCDGR